MLAFLPPEQQQRTVEQMRLTPKTPRSITSRSAFFSELASVRRQGCGENLGESEPGMCSIAAPIRDPFGRVVASVSVAAYVPDVTVGLRHLARPVVETAMRISAGLSGQR